MILIIIALTKFILGVVVGIPTVLFGGIGTINFSYVDLIVMILSSLLLFVFSIKNEKISRCNGIVFLLIFLAYYSYVLIG